jgi:hypothetical protein
MQTKTKIISIAAASLVFLSLIPVGAFLGYRFYRTRLLKEKIEEAIGRDAGYTETILRVEKDSSNMNYQELFELCDKSIDGRTNLIVELRGLYPDIRYELKEKLIDFLNDENELIRAKRSLYRKSLKFSTKREALQEKLQDATCSGCSVEYYVEQKARLKRELDQLIQSVSEVEGNADEFHNRYQTVVEKERILSQSLNNAQIRFNSIFAKYQEENNKAVLDAKKGAQNWRRGLAALSEL